MKKFLGPRKLNECDMDENDLGALLYNKPKPYKLIEQAFISRHIHIYISEEIGDPHDYIDMIHTINTAGPEDTIFIHLNTNGGRLDTGIQIINAMRNTMAAIVTILEGEAHSLGTVIFLSGDELVVNDNCMMMFHNFKGGVVGKGNELTSELEATVKWFSTLARDIYIPFLSSDEVDRLLKGEDIWMGSKEIKKRLANVERLLEEEADKPKRTRKTKEIVSEEDADVVPDPEKTTKTKRKTAK